MVDVAQIDTQIRMVVARLGTVLSHNILCTLSEEAGYSKKVLVSQSLWAKVEGEIMQDAGQSQSLTLIERSKENAGGSDRFTHSLDRFRRLEWGRMMDNRN